MSGYRFPFEDEEKPITPQEADRYEPLFTEEYHFFKSTIAKSIPDTVAEELLIKYMNQKLTLMKKDSNSKSILNYLLFTFDFLSPVLRWFGINTDHQSFSAILDSNSWGFLLNCGMQVLPLFITTVIEMESPQQFNYFSCNSCASTTPTPDCFTNSCTGVPMDMLGFNVDYPTSPVPSLTSTAPCTGLANAIANNVLSFSLTMQYFLYASLLLFGVRLSQLELEENNYCRFALHLKGVFITPTNKEVIRKGLPKDSWWLSSPWALLFYRYSFSVFPYAITAVYIFTICYLPPAGEEWFIFPSAQTGSDYDVAYGPDFIGWCSALSTAGTSIKVSYLQPPSDSIASRFLQAFLFLTSVISLVSAQAKHFDWIDTEKYMNESEKEDCPYYEVHQNRSRVFNSLMLNDWLVVNLYYPLYKDAKENGFEVFKNPSCFEKALSEEKQALALQAMENVQKVIDPHYVPSNPEGALPLPSSTASPLGSQTQNSDLDSEV